MFDTGFRLLAVSHKILPKRGNIILGDRDHLPIDRQPLKLEVFFAAKVDKAG